MVLPSIPALLSRRVVITGLGLLTPLGVNVEQSWLNLCAGKSGIHALPSNPQTSDLEVRIAGTLPAGFEREKWLNAVPYAKNLLNAYATAVTTEALANAQWKPETEEEKNRSGVIFGSSFGCLSTILENQTRVGLKGFAGMDRFAMLKALTNLAAGHLAIQFQLKGPSTTVNTACASGQTAVGEAFHMIRRGDADVMVAGGAEEGVQPFLLAGFSKIGALNADSNGHPEGANQPFDLHRKGFVLGEGAGALILEDLDHAVSRKAQIYAEILGFSSTVDAEYLTKPMEDGDGAYRAMQVAMQQAGIEAKDVDMVKAHGTGSEDGDVAELTAILRVFKTPGPVITATKGSTGHLLGAAGAVEAVFAALAVHSDLIPPMINLKQPLRLYAGMLKPHYATSLLKQRVGTVVANAYGFGGVNTSLVLAKLR